MKKKVILIFICLLFSLNIYSNFLYSPFSNVAFATSNDDFKANPASVPFCLEKNRPFVLGFNYKDDINKASYKNGEFLPFIQNPNTFITLDFYAENFALSTSFGLIYENKTPNVNDFNIDIINKNIIEANIAYEFFGFSIGAKIHGGWINEKKVFVDNYFDLIFNVFNESAIKNSAFMCIGLGTMYVHDYFSIGFNIDDFFFLNEDSKIDFDTNTMLDSMNMGFSLTMPSYNSKGDLFYVIPRLGVQLIGLKTIEVSLEARVKLEYLSNIALASNYLYDFELNKHMYSLALDIEIQGFDVRLETLMFENLELIFSYAF